MRVICAGVDPAGVYLAARLKADDPTRDVQIIDTGNQNTAAQNTAAPPHIMQHPLKPGWRLADAHLERAISAACRAVHGVRIRTAQTDVATNEQAYAFIGAGALNDLLRERARAAGCRFVAGP